MSYNFFELLLIEPNDVEEVEAWNDFAYVEETDPYQREYLKFRNGLLTRFLLDGRKVKK